MFAEWAAHFGRAYAGDAAEAEARLGAWLHTLRHVLADPAPAAEVPVNGFADMSDDEFRAAYLGQSTPEDGASEEGALGCDYFARLDRCGHGLVESMATSAHIVRRAAAGAPAYRYAHMQPPAAVDWRPKDIIGPIKDQHANGSACGCCWAFATIGTAECMVAMATGKVLSLSEQQVRGRGRRFPARGSRMCAYLAAMLVSRRAAGARPGRYFPVCEIAHMLNFTTLLVSERAAGARPGRCSRRVNLRDCNTLPHRWSATVVIL